MGTVPKGIQNLALRPAVRLFSGELHSVPRFADTQEGLGSCGARGNCMRITRAIALGIALVWPALMSPGLAGATEIECRRLTSQIEHFSNMVERADQLDNAIWVERARDHLDQLVARRAEECPGYSAGAQAMQAFAQLMRIAGRAALTYFTFGAF